MSGEMKWTIHKNENEWDEESTQWQIRWHKSEKVNYDLCPYFLVGKYICQSKNKLPQEKQKQDWKYM